MSVISVPTFDFSKFYYAEIYEALVQYKRINAPELTDESEFEPTMFLLKAFALVGHLNDVLLDVVANESTLKTAKLAETVRNMLRLIDYELSPATPSQADLIYELSKVFTSSFEVVSERAQSATKRTETVDPIYFEALTALTIDRTDQYSYVLGDEDGTFTDHTSDANSPTTPADDWTPWSTPASKDAIYFGHKQVMWNEIDVTITTVAANIIGIYEYYTSDWQKDSPTSVTDLGTTLRFNLTSVLGTTDRTNTLVRVQLNSTGAYEDVYSTWTGSENRITTTGLLGQTTPSTTATDYSVGFFWTPIQTITDNTSNFTQEGKVEFTLPQDTNSNWEKTTVDGKSAYWLRYRIISVSTPTAPTFKRVRMDTGKQYVLREATQGRTYIEDPLGSSDGSSGQRFQTAKDNFILKSEIVTVDSETWIRVDNFLNSESGSKHYSVELGNNDRATIVFGGEGAGMAPPSGTGNISITYRYGAEKDGNVGQNTITIDKTGLTFVSSINNPRQASGWAEAQGASTESLEKAKIEGPASIRTKGVAVGPVDLIEMTKSYKDSSGVSLFSRATAVEGAYGPKTTGLVVVAAGGGAATSAQLEDLEDYFNGNKTAIPQIEKHMLFNNEVVAENYSTKTIDITAVVYGNVTVTQIETGLTNIFKPEAKKADGVTFMWDFGASIPVTRISHEIFSIDSSITKTNITVPSADVTLLSNELPSIGTLSITVVTSS